MSLILLYWLPSFSNLRWLILWGLCFSFTCKMGHNSIVHLFAKAWVVWSSILEMLNIALRHLFLALDGTHLLQNWTKLQFSWRLSTNLALHLISRLSFNLLLEALTSLFAEILESDWGSTILPKQWSQALPFQWLCTLYKALTVASTSTVLSLTLNLLVTVPAITIWKNLRISWMIFRLCNLIKAQFLSVRVSHLTRPIFQTTLLLNSPWLSTKPTQNECFPLKSGFRTFPLPGCSELTTTWTFHTSMGISISDKMGLMLMFKRFIEIQMLLHLTKIWQGAITYLQVWLLGL